MSDPDDEALIEDISEIFLSLRCKMISVSADELELARTGLARFTMTSVSDPDEVILDDRSDIFRICWYGMSLSLAELVLSLLTGLARRMLISDADEEVILEVCSEIFCIPWYGMSLSLPELLLSLLTGLASRMLTSDADEEVTLEDLSVITSS